MLFYPGPGPLTPLYTLRRTHPERKRKKKEKRKRKRRKERKEKASHLRVCGFEFLVHA